MLTYRSILLVTAAAALTAGCSGRGAAGGPVPHPFPQPRQPGGVLAPAPASLEGYGIAGTALSLRGVPYVDGGTDVSGFDCSGLVRYVFARHGLDVPRTVAAQFRTGRHVSPQALEAGDLLFFNTKGAGATHVGIAIGGDEFVHAPSGSGAVRVERLGSPYWSSRFVGARRLL